MSDKSNQYSQIRNQFTDYAKLYIRYARLTMAEKVTVFLTAGAVAVAAFVLAVVFIFFISMAAAHWLAPYIGLGWGYASISFMYLILIAILFIFRKPFIMNPIARFISKLFLS
ncbi:MAG: phage holin family protein [Paramuribaculum sp.]|nr:phage holin family protein [Paramuribaculum sp.]